MSHIVGKIVLFLWQVGHFPTDLCENFVATDFYVCHLRTLLKVVKKYFQHTCSKRGRGGQGP